MSGPLDRYLSRVQQSMTLRQTAAFPEIAGLVVICVTAVASYIVLSLWLVPADLPREWRFRSETGSVTALSGVFLVAGAACAFVSFLRYPRLAEVFAIAFFFYLVHTFVDRDTGSTNHVFGDSRGTKLLGSACLAFGSFVGTIGVVWNRPHDDACRGREHVVGCWN